MTISIHALLAESDIIALNPPIKPAISIHALLAESDADTLIDDVSTGGFLSTLSLRRATCALRQLQSALCHFYPRSPCGERLGLSYFYIIKITISIHALLAESDSRLDAEY